MSLGVLRGGVPDHLAQRVGYASATIEYHGWASPGIAEGTAAWAIYRVTLDSQGRPTAVEWADGDAESDNVWSDRASLLYS